MKIVLAAGLYPPDIGGPATFAKQLVESLTLQENVQVEVVSFREVRHLKPGIRHMVYCLKLWQKSRSAEAIVALDPVSVGLSALVVSKLRGIKFFVRVGGDYAWEQGVQRFGVTETLDSFVSNKPNHYSFGVQGLILLQSLVAQSATRVVVPSDYLKSVVLLWGVAAQNSTRIYSSAHVGTLTSKEEARSQWKFTNEKVILSAGRFVPWKGFPVLINVALELKKVFPNILLVIAGSGPDDAKIREYAQVSGVPVRFMGDMKKEELLSLVVASDVFALNTNYEGLSHQLIEVMQAGTPVVTTHVGGNVELIEDGVSGRLLAFNDKDAFVSAITDVFNDIGKAGSKTEQLVHNAKIRAQEFSSVNSMEEWQKLLHTSPCARLHVLMISGDALVQTQTSGVYKRLLVQARQVASLIVFVRGSKNTTPLLSEGEVRGFGGSKILVALAMMRAGRLMEHVDVVTAQDPFLLGFVAWRIARSQKVPLQLQIHTNIFAAAFKKKYFFKSHLAHFLLRRADSIRVVSDELKQQLLQAGVKAPISVLPIYIDTEAIQKVAPFDFSSQYPQFTHSVVVAARLEKEKHVEEILDAWPEVLKQLPDAGLFIAGEGKEKAALQKHAVALGIAGHVVFLGYRNDVYELYKGADVVFAATAEYEGYGATAVEALAAGTPVVSVRDAGVVKQAGGSVVPQPSLAEEIVRILNANLRGELRMTLPTMEEWAVLWQKGLIGSRVKV